MLYNLFNYSLLMRKRNTKEELTNLRSFASKVRLYRHALKISQSQLAEIIDCHINALGRIERAQADPTFIMIFRISKALNVSLRDLMPDN
jgi:transcriptional regulator with XRE-family HTH domain